jgi:hypothetical protein
MTDAHEIEPYRTKRRDESLPAIGHGNGEMTKGASFVEHLDEGLSVVSVLIIFLVLMVIVLPLICIGVIHEKNNQVTR